MVKADQIGQIQVGDAMISVSDSVGDIGFSINSSLDIFFFFTLTTLVSLSGNSDRLTWVRLRQPQEQRYPVLQVLAGSFRVSVIYRTLTWTA